MSKMAICRACAAPRFPASGTSIRALSIGTLALVAFPTLASADTTLAYRDEGNCAGDFARFELKSHWLRVDAAAGSLIYDHEEKVAYFVDDRTRSYMETELDEDAVDLQSDIMKSFRARMRREAGGVDPLALARSACPGAGGNARDRMPNEAIDCGNGMTLDNGAGANGGTSPEAARQMAESMMQQQLATMPPEQREAMQRMLAGPGASAMTIDAGSTQPPAPSGRIDRDIGETTVDGIPCMRREHVRGGEKVREDCYAPASALRLDPADARRIARFGASLGNWSRSIAPDGSAAAGDGRVLVRRVCYAGGHESGRATLSVGAGPIDASRFAPPSGYSRMDPMDGAPGRRN